MKMAATEKQRKSIVDPVAPALSGFTVERKARVAGRVIASPKPIILKEIRTTYNRFLACSAYWKPIVPKGRIHLSKGQAIVPP